MTGCLPDIDYPLHDKINFGTVFAARRSASKKVHDDIWLVSFMEYDLGYFDLETRVLEPLENPFGPKVSPMSPGRPAKLVGLGGFEPPTRSLGNCCSIHLSYSPTSQVIVARGFGVSALGRHRHSLQVLNFLLNVSLAAT